MSYNTNDAARLIGVSRNTLRNFQFRDFAAPETPDKKWSMRQVLALGVLISTRRQGASLKAALAAYDMLRRKSIDDLQADFDGGRQYLVLLGETMTLRLVGRERAFDPSLQEKAMKDQSTLTVVDVKLAVERIETAIQKTKSKATSTA